MAGRLVHHKGIDLGHRASELAHTTHPLRIAGLGPAIDSLNDVEPLGWLNASLREPETPEHCSFQVAGRSPTESLAWRHWPWVHR